MAIRTILTVLSDPDTAQGVLEVAAALAEKNSAHLIGLYAEAPEQVYIYAPMDVPNPSTIAALQESARERMEKVEAIFQKQMQLHSISQEWRKFQVSGGYTSPGVIDSARSVDLVISGQLDEDTPKALRSDLEILMFECGRPVMLVPYIQKKAREINKAIIAWNGSREAARAAFDALPLLIGAKEVEILSIDAKDDFSQTSDLAGSELAASLSRHGVRVTINNLLSGGQPVGVTIENRVSDFGADLLIMGAYTHSRIRERIFGGATNTLLGSMTTLTLLSR